MRVLRVYHSAVVDAWRERDRLLRSAGHDLVLVSPVRWNEGGADVALDLGADEFVVPARTWGRHPYMFVYDPRPIWRALRAHDPAVFDAHEEPASLAAVELLLLRLLTRRRSAKVLFYGAQNLPKRFPPPFRWIERLALRTAAATYCCNSAAGEIFRAKGFRGEVAVIGLGVDVDRFSPRSGDRAPGPFRVGYVGRLERRKGVHVVIEAMRSLPDDVVLEIHGSGPDEDSLRSTVEANGLASRVTLHGYCDHAQLPDVYRSLDALVVPSQTTERWVEQFGRVAVEAMASGVPVVSSDSGALPEVLAGAGVVVPESDAAAWAAAVLRLRDDPAEASRCVTAGLERARSFSWTAVAAEHGTLYSSVVRQ